MKIYADYRRKRGDETMSAYAAGPKKMMIVNILEILKRHSDSEHRLLQKDIIALLKSEYSMDCDRKAVSRNLTDLLEADFPIEYGGGWYYVHDFNDSELRLLIDGILFLKHIPYTQCKALIDKLQGLSSRYFSARVKHIRNLPENMPVNKQLFYTIEVLDEAISRGRQVAFHYNVYDMDKKLRLRLDDAGNVRRYVINPYQIVATNGRYYLICNHDKYSNVANYRLDLITDIELLETPVKDMKKVEGLEHGLNLPKHMAEHIYLFHGEGVPVKFKAGKRVVSDIVDWFGKDVTFTDAGADKCVVSVKVNEEAMFCWALQYGPHVEVIEPAGLRERIKLAVAEMAKKYK